MARVRPYVDAQGVLGGYTFWCHACDERHEIGLSWGFNGDLERPTFTPSILVTGIQEPTEEEWTRIEAGEKDVARPLRCHSFITDGAIQYCSDSLHDFAGETMMLVEIPDAIPD